MANNDGDSKMKDQKDDKTKDEALRKWMEYVAKYICFLSDICSVSGTHLCPGSTILRSTKTINSNIAM